MCDFFSFMVSRNGKEIEVFFTPQTNSHSKMAEILFGDSVEEDKTWKFEITPQSSELVVLPQTPEELEMCYDGGLPWGDLLPMEKWEIIKKLNQYQAEIDFLAVMRSESPVNVGLAILERDSREKLQKILEFPQDERISLNRGKNMKTFLISDSPSQYWFWSMYIHHFKTNMGQDVKELRSFLYQAEYDI